MAGRASFLGLGLLTVLVGISPASTAEPLAAEAGRADTGATPTEAFSQIDQAIAGAEIQEQSLSKELLAVEEELRTLHNIQTVMGRAYVRAIRAGLLPLASGFDQFQAHAARVEKLRHTLARDLERQKVLEARRSQINPALLAVQGQRRGLLEQQRVMGQARNAVLAEQDRQQAFLRAFSGSQGPGYTAVYGAEPGPGDPRDVRVSFRDKKGRLAFPLPGRAEIHAVHRAGASGFGLELRGPKGAPVRAVFPGRVAFADDYANYGMTLILDHGDGYHTVSANLGQILVRVGDEVTQGTVVGTVGDTGGGALLYFEIRKGGANLDPSEWLGI